MQTEPYKEDLDQAWRIIASQNATIDYLIKGDR